jgi:hypothetical protein
VAGAQVEAHASSRTGTRYLVIGSGMTQKTDVTVMSPASATAASVEAAVLRMADS